MKSAILVKVKHGEFTVKASNLVSMFLVMNGYKQESMMFFINELHDQVQKILIGQDLVKFMIENDPSNSLDDIQFINYTGTGSLKEYTKSFINSYLEKTQIENLET